MLLPTKVKRIKSNYRTPLYKNEYYDAIFSDKRNEYFVFVNVKDSLSNVNILDSNTINQIQLFSFFGGQDSFSVTKFERIEVNSNELGIYTYRFKDKHHVWGYGVYLIFNVNHRFFYNIDVTVLKIKEEDFEKEKSKLIESLEFYPQQ